MWRFIYRPRGASTYRRGVASPAEPMMSYPIARYIILFAPIWFVKRSLALLASGRLFLIDCVVVVTLFAALQTTNTEGNMDAKALTSTIARFSAKFCNEVDKEKNTVSSPLSAEFLLALLALGTTDAAHTELLNAFDIPDDDSLRVAFGEVTTKLKGVKGVTLRIANKVYIMEGPYELNAQLKDDAFKYFDAAMEKINFSDNEGSSKTINDWVESRTNNKIKDLISSDSVSRETRLVLVNALYFKGMWKKRFDPKNTIEQPFHVNSKVNIDVPMMYMEDNFRYGFSEHLEAQLLEMSYEGDWASMLIVLPHETEGLNTVLEKLAEGYDLMADVENMSETKVQVYVPKFKIETEIDLMQLLPKLGVKTIFNPYNSGITKMLSTKESLYISKAVQKAFIEVNEEGAEAAAATGMVMMLRCAMMTPSFRADRPYLYMLLGPHRTPLFVGTYRASE